MPFHWKTCDGEDRVAHAWQREGSRGVLACVHGLSGCGEQFEPVADHLDSFSVYAMELRGQGLDPVPGRRAMVLDLEAQHRDISDFLAAIRESNPGQPVFLMGESMGALLCASFAATSTEAGVEGMILSVPVVGLARKVPEWLRNSVRILGRAFPGLKFYPSWFVSGRTIAPPLTRDKAYQDSMRGKPHYLKVFTLKFLSELSDLMEQSHPTAEKIRIPTLVLAAGKDCFVQVSQVEAWFGRIGARDKTLRVYPEAYHLLWHDHDRESVLADVGAWLKSRLPEK